MSARAFPQRMHGGVAMNIAAWLAALALVALPLVGVTNGSNQLELQPWGAESGFNLSPMLSGRVGVLLPFKKGVELSVNGAVGVQDRQSA